MHKTTLYLDDDAYRRLQSLAEAAGRTQASVVREALAIYTAGKRRRPRSIGLGRSGTKSLSDRAEDLLEGFGK